MSAAEIARALAGQAETVVRGLFPHGRLDGRDWCIGSIAGEPGQSLRIGLTGKYRGRWREYADGTHGDLLDLIAAVRCGGDLRQAIGWARRWLGREHVVPKRANRKPSKGQPARYETLSPYGRQIWSSCRAINSESPAALYLGARGCALPHPDGDLRWHPALKHQSGFVGPALIGLVTNVHTCEPINLHTTWINGDGSGRKAFDHLPREERPQARLLLKGHRKAGGCIRLWPDCDVTFGIGVAEGIESTLTLARVFTPVWACIDAGNMAALPYLCPVESLTVAVDHDTPGVKAYAAVAERWHAAGAEVRRVISPVPGEDLNDWVAGYA